MELKPCLKCYSKNVHYLEEEHHPLHQFDGIVVCDDCELEVKCTPEQWNTRATDPLLKEMAEVLKQMADIYYGRDNQPFAGSYARKMDEVLIKYHEQVSW